MSQCHDVYPEQGDEVQSAGKAAGTLHLRLATEGAPCHDSYDIEGPGEQPPAQAGTVPASAPHPGDEKT